MYSGVSLCAASASVLQRARCGDRWFLRQFRVGTLKVEPVGNRAFSLEAMTSVETSCTPCSFLAPLCCLFIYLCTPSTTKSSQLVGGSSLSYCSLPEANLHHVLIPGLPISHRSPFPFITPSPRLVENHLSAHFDPRGFPAESETPSCSLTKESGLPLGRQEAWLYKIGHFGRQRKHSSAKEIREGGGEEDYVTVFTIIVIDYYYYYLMAHCSSLEDQTQEATDEKTESERMLEE